ncbi:MAG: hypothetical protein ACRCS9_10970 [Hyphomicrobium sp.]
MSSEAERFVDGLQNGDGRGLVPPQARRTLQAIASLMHERPASTSHRVCYAVLTTIAWRAGLSEKSARRHLAALELAGVVERERKTAAGAGRGGVICTTRIVGFSDLVDIASVRSDGPNGQTATTKRTYTTRPNGHRVPTIIETLKNQHKPSARERAGQMAAGASPANQTLRTITADDPLFNRAVDVVFANSTDDERAAVRRHGRVAVRPEQMRRVVA